MILSSLLLAACFGPAKYERQYNETACARYDECGWTADLGWESTEDCVAAHEKFDDEKRDDCEGYRRRDARDCIDELELISCDDLANDVWPVACETLCD